MSCSTSLRLSFVMAVAAAAATIYIAGSSAAPKKPRIQTGPNAEVSFDGLVRVDRSVVTAAWVKPDLDLTRYKKLMVASEGVKFRALEAVSASRARSASQFPVKEENRQRLTGILKEEFTKELAKLQRYQIVDAPGDDVLLVVGAVLDVVSSVPPDIDSAKFASGGVYLTSVGQATLVIELRDSESGEVLARAADKRAAESPFTFQANNVTVWSEVQRLAQRWASLLRSNLEQLEGV